MIFFFITISFMSVTYYKYGVVDYDVLVKSAAVLTRPTALPENEGKLVIIKGTPKVTKKYYDKEYKEEFYSPSVTRRVEVYKGRDKTGERWETESTVYFTGGAKLGDFVLDDSIIKAMPLNGNYELEIGGYHNKRVIYSLAKCVRSKYTIIGIQKGHTLVHEKELKMGCVFEGKCNVQQILAKSEDNGKFNRGAAIVFFVCSVIVGAFSWLFLAAQIVKNNTVAY